MKELWFLFNPELIPLSGAATTPGQSGPVSDGKKGVLCHSPKHYWNVIIRLFSVISRTLVGGGYPSAEKQSVYSTAPADWAIWVMRRVFVNGPGDRGSIPGLIIPKIQKIVLGVALLRFSLVSLFNGISTLFRLFNAKAILLEEQ